jgi:hypothetical protein
MATIFPVDPAPDINDEFQGYRYAGNGIWEIIGVALTDDYAEVVSGLISDNYLSANIARVADVETSLEDYILLSEKGEALGVAELDAAGKIPNSQNTASPSFTSISLTNPLSYTDGGTGKDTLGNSGDVLAVNSTGDGFAWVPLPGGLSGDTLTEEDVQDIVDQLISAGDHSNLDITYDDALNKISFALTEDVTITGNLTVQGDLTYTNELVITDSLIYLADGNNTQDVVDIGIFGGYNDGTYGHTGLVRDASDKVWKLFSDAGEPSAGVVDFTGATFDKLKIGSLESVGNVVSHISISSTSVSATLSLTDDGTVVETNSSSANTITVPTDASVAFPVGTQITVVQMGSGQTTITPASGVTINSTPGLKIRAQYSAITLIKRATNTWIAIGDLSA